MLHWHMKQTRQLGTLLGCVSWCVLRIPGDVNRIYVHTIGVRVITRALYVMVWSVRVITLTPVHMLAHPCPLRYTGMDPISHVRVITRNYFECPPPLRVPARCADTCNTAGPAADVQAPTTAVGANR